VTRSLRILARFLAGAAITTPGGGRVYSATVGSLGDLPEVAPERAAPIPARLAPLPPAVLPSGALLS
jgi:hypothetical protein